MGGVKLVTCYGCGLEGHKKGYPACRAGKFDAHVSAPQDYKDRMAKKKKANVREYGKQSALYCR